MSLKKPKWINTVEASFKEDDVFWNNEIKANIFVSFSLFILALVLILSYFLASVGVFDVPMDQMRLTLLINIPLMAAAIAVSNVFKGQKHWIKYMLCIVYLFTTGALCAILNIFVTLIVAIPVVLSVRYYSARLTRTIAFLSVIDMAVSLYLFGTRGIVDLNLVIVPYDSTLHVVHGLRNAVVTNGFDMGKYLGALVRGSLMPRLLLFLIISVTCVELAKRAQENILEQAAISRKTESIRA